jgi:polar amino acid transport system substrate-binding protein
MDSVNIPYSGDDTQKGMIEDFIDMINSQSELDMNIQYIPWKRCLRDVELGDIDGAFALVHTSKRDSQFSYPKDLDNQLDRSKRIWTVKYPVFVPNESKLDWDGVNFNQSDILLSAPFGFVAYEKLKEVGVLSEGYLDKVRALELVNSARLDGYVVEQSIGENLLREMQLTEKFKTLETPFLSTDWYLVLSNDYVEKHPEKATRLWDLLEQVREEFGEALYKKNMTVE